MTMEFRCNLRCVHCMIEDTMHRLAPELADQFDELLAENARASALEGIDPHRFRNHVASRSADLARRARAAGFEHVRIQTHGMHLAQQAYCDAWSEAGVDEYFVSVAGPDAETHDAITTVPGSFDKTLRGLEILDGNPKAVTLTNTVVTKPKLQTSAGGRRSPRAFASSRSDGVLGLLADERSGRQGFGRRHTAKSLPYLREALSRARALGRGVEVKNFPQCLLGDDGAGADEHAAAAVHRPGVLAGIHAQWVLPVRLSRPLRLDRMSGSQHRLHREVRLR